ncbi:hypothetical protein ACQP2H_04425 [Micromonospora sp. CA-248260]|uniref:hypothetical protein n=1 Tax=Micromonospora sp. CA-248260 TaxID=3239962 RepID=UPI003D8A3FC0
MIERGSGRTSGLTDWQLMDVLSMWACLQDQETQGHWKHVAGWRKVCDLAQAHLRRLQQYRSGLAEAWPPATNDAAKAYLGELDELISRVQHTHDTAAANHDALAAAARAIDSTRPQLKRLHDEYATKLQQKRGYEATLADPKAAMGSRVVDPPVSDGDLERLNVQARGIMFGLSGELQQAQAMLQKPPSLPPKLPSKDPSNSDAYGITAPPVAIPPIAPIPISGSSGTKDRRSSTARRGVPVPPISQGGPVLGTTGVAPSQLVNTATTPTPPTTPNPNGGQLPIPPTTPPQGTSNYTEVRNRSNASPIRSSPETSRGVSQKKPTFPAHPNGLIGSTPSIGFTQPPTQPPPRKINPIGGVIGGGAAGTTPTGGAGSRPGGGRQTGGTQIPPFGGGPLGSMGTTSGWGSQSRRPDEIGRHWNPDQPWEVQGGVPPVVRPPDDGGPIDPGPAIGHNR